VDFFISACALLKAVSPEILDWIAIFKIYGSRQNEFVAGGGAQ